MPGAAVMTVSVTARLGSVAKTDSLDEGERVTPVSDGRQTTLLQQRLPSCIAQSCSSVHANFTSGETTQAEGT